MMIVDAAAGYVSPHEIISMPTVLMNPHVQATIPIMLVSLETPEANETPALQFS